jgi:hypothetical protein
MRILESLADWDADVAMMDDLEGDLFDHEQHVTPTLGSIDTDMLGIKEAARDMHRWELDPASAEDWAERRKR